MKSTFCQWCTDLQVIASKDGVVIEAQMFDSLIYLFRIGTTPENAYPCYLDTKRRIEAIQETEKLIQP